MICTVEPKRTNGDEDQGTPSLEKNSRGQFPEVEADMQTDLFQLHLLRTTSFTVINDGLTVDSACKMTTGIEDCSIYLNPYPLLNPYTQSRFSRLQADHVSSRLMPYLKRPAAESSGM